MGPLVSSVPPALWVPGCLALLLWLWVLCAACHSHPLAPRKRVQRQPAGLQGSVMPTATQVRHQAARSAPGPTPSSPAASQHGSLGPTMSGSVQRHRQAAGCLLTPGTAPDRACYHRCPALRGSGGHLLQRGAGGHPQGQPGGQPRGVGRGTADQQLGQTWA
ncbi:Lck interacting transmembrane adaptor 1 [Phyllostomus discolor]|uniref:Lck interacting transmembrane adaptor 1 n=1 Tax=Phyllostomus discolor TaxID=89673 RepID=A0A833Z177_9CHIR|nr:Lck interacting transmembrane adaptor 1 [Phyllostomus discolor]